MINAGSAAVAPNIVPTNKFVSGKTMKMRIINGTALNKLIIKSKTLLIILLGYNPSSCVI